MAASASAAPSTIPRFRRGQNKIVGGTDVAPGEIPYQLSFQEIVAGENKMYTHEGTEQNRDIIKIILHEKYDPFTVENDISLLKVAAPLVFNDYVQPAKLPELHQEFEGNAIVSGWGRMSEWGNLPSVLQKVTVPIVSDEDCKKDYGELALVKDSMMCAGEEGKDSCQGDSGGPMTCDGYLCGVVSWGRGCAEAGYPGVYTQVSYFVDWIKANSA
ncbi:hypothetical protein HAZT_HAZT010158 [Hyalella azteca]|uniref:Peptidase S1 domain-containing protein n=1 Tax=Hyalella azteca TaxID=294128 RepID=A0A6A0H1I0_HYAAZ|nr:hypothetical protein HAZT_HAZT010158 [Hyalella azteca]